MAVNDTVAAIASAMEQAYGGTMTSVPLAELRAMTDGMIPPSAIEVGRVIDANVPSPDREIPVRIYWPTASDSPTGALLWLHGGGFALGGLALGDDLSRRLCEALQVVVVNVDYAVAPENPFPAALDDCSAVYEWIRSTPVELSGANTTQVAVAGDSAGGNLAMVLSLKCRDEGLPLPACQVSIYGTAECVVSNPGLGDLVFLTSEDAEWFWDNYTAERDNPYVAPLRAESVAGLPPLLVVTAEHDPTRDASERYAERVAAEGGVATANRYPGVHHGFFGLVDLLDESRAAFSHVVTFIAEYLEERI